MPTPAPSRLDDQRHDYTSDASDFAGDYEQRGTITSAEVTSDKEQLVTKGKMSLPSQLIRAALFGLAIGVPAMATTNAGNANIYLYQQELGVDSASILRASLFSGLISTFSALLFGFYSDSIETRFGRRRPFVLAGALLQAASIYLLCSPSMDFSPEGAADYLLAVSVVQNVAADIFGLSVAAWAAEGAASVPFQSPLTLTPNPFPSDSGRRRSRTLPSLVQGAGISGSCGKGLPRELYRSDPG